MIRLGVIGCGRVTSMFHLKAIKQLPEITVSAVLDIDEARMLETQREAGAEKAYHDSAELFNDLDVDAVVINTPPRFHEEITLKALEHGKHVLCEKPLAKTVEGCRRIEKAQQKTGLVVLPAHNYVFTPSLTMMSEAMTRLDLGKITGVSVRFENNLSLYRSQTDFRKNSSHGVVDDVLPHVLSVIYPLTGHVSAVDSVQWWCKDYKVCDNMITELSTGGVPVEAHLSWTKLLTRFNVSVDFERGQLSTDLMMNPYKLDVCFDGKHETIREKGLDWYLDLVRFRHPSFRNQYSHFQHLIETGDKPLVTIEDEVNMLETMSIVKETMS